MSKYLVIIVIFLLVVSYLFKFVIPGKIQITLDPSTNNLQNAIVSLSSDNFTKNYPIPSTITLKPGKYSLKASASRTDQVVQYFVVKSLQTSKLAINLPISQSDLAEVPYGKLFPYETIDYRLIADLDSTGTNIKQIRIIIDYRFSDPNDPASVQQEQDFIANEAKQWLKDQGVPENIPAVIDNKTEY